ncbi:nuclear transport factor 2 family protein [Scytonema sp. UIC 10036]|uniref:nuclear transport factor 2 family protein n=1 Tax=Scytonema sp. UIC 10036 TaxID=2304196 RepID=UPI0012DA2579|nr:nuclear transport factor 2 family protein [Scytonema sp. UIC 10036]MUG99383.1 nuclear transport factor 2 family protein [Scytonema sp. UIC 10036]
MQPLANSEQQTSAELFTTFLSLMGKNIQALMDLYAEDAVVEFPYASGTPRRLEGKKVISNYLKDALGQMQGLTFTNIRVYETTNLNVLWAEFHGEAVIISTGRQYQQDYVTRLETKGGKIAYYCEYWNLMSAIEAWGGTQNLHQSFNAEDTE